MRAIVKFHLCLLLYSASACLMAGAAEQERSYYSLNQQNGLSSNCVLQLLQLPDGRMVVVTQQAIDMYDGQSFSSVRIDTTRWMPVPAYNGATHLFADNSDRLWMKQWGRLYCVNLRTMRQDTIGGWRHDDFFIDGRGETWLLKGRQLAGRRYGRPARLFGGVILGGEDRDIALQGARFGLQSAGASVHIHIAFVFAVFALLHQIHRS